MQTGKTAARLQGTVYNFLNDDLFHYQMRITGREWTVEDLTDWEIWNGDFTGAPDDGEEFADTYDVEVAVDRLRFGAFSATDVSGRFSGKGLHVESDNVFLRHSGGSLSGRMEWVPMPNDEGQLLLDGQINRVDLKALMASMDNFGQSQLTSEQLSGILDATFRISAPFDADFNLKSDKLLAQVDFQVAKGRITGFEPLQELSRFAEVEDLKDVRFGTVKNQLRIADQTVFIPEMTLENNALVLKVAGEHRFDNVMDFTLQMQLRDLVGGKKTPAPKRSTTSSPKNLPAAPSGSPSKSKAPPTTSNSASTKRPSRRTSNPPFRTTGSAKAKSFAAFSKSPSNAPLSRKKVPIRVGRRAGHQSFLQRNASFVQPGLSDAFYTCPC